MILVRQPVKMMKIPSPVVFQEDYEEYTPPKHTQRLHLNDAKQAHQGISNFEELWLVIWASQESKPVNNSWA